MAASDSGAEGGTCFNGDQPPTVANVTNTYPSNPSGTPGGATVTVASLESVTDDRREGGDIDKPYPAPTTFPLLPQV